MFSVEMMTILQCDVIYTGTCNLHMALIVVRINIISNEYVNDSANEWIQISY